MGVIKELLLLPLAPVRGTVWVAEQLAAEAERQLDPRVARRRALLALDQRLAAGEIDVEEYDFEQALARARREDAEIGLDYALSGPWPPYNFAEPLPAGG